MREECAEFGALMGFTRGPQTVGSLGSWLVSDTASDVFAQPVPEDALAGPVLVVIRETVDLVRIDDEWVSMERVKAADLEAWKVKKWTGGGRDPRITGLSLDALGKRFVTEMDAITKWRPQ